MKRVVLSGAALLAAFILPGCPVYPRDEACFNDYDCPVGSACYQDGYCAPIGGGGRGGASSIGSCDEPSDCKANETCGSDARCHTGSCRFHKCVSGFSCDAVEGVWTCVRGSGTGGAGGSYGTGGSYGVGGSQSTDAQVYDAPRPDTGSGGAGGESDATVDQTVPDAAGGSSDAAAD